MAAERWFYPLALCFMCVSSYPEYFIEQCETQKLSAPLGSSVLLPCNLKSPLNWVSWVQTPEVHLVNLTSEGRIKFLDHRNGRVKVFPNQGSEGNYSIYIDELQNSDLGSYRCKQGNDCLEVELVVDTAGELSKERKLLIYICVGVTSLVLLGASGYCCMKCIMLCNDRNPDYVNDPVCAGTSAPPEEPGTGPVDWQQQGEDHDNPVYENDNHEPAYVQEDTRDNRILPGLVHYMDEVQPTQSASGIYPDLNQCNFERVESKRTKQRFHRELISRLRQASFNRHYYVNQVEISNQRVASSQVEKQHRGLRKNKTEENCEYTNPIYNRSKDHFNQL